MIRCVSLILLAALFAGCTRIKPEAPARTHVDSTLSIPLSELNVPVFIPLADLERMANAKLKAKVFETRVPLSKNNDTLELAISRFKPIALSYNGKRGITYSLPIQIDGHLRSRVAGIKIQNKTPVTAQVIVTLYSDLYLNQDWNLNPNTKLLNIQWEKEPFVKVAGIKVNLTKPLEKALRQHESKLTEKLDQTIREAAKIKASIEKLWTDIQKPIRINRNKVPVWLKADAENMDARIYVHSKDTLMIEVGLKARIETLLDSVLAAAPKTPLPPFRVKRENSPGLNAFVKVTVPFENINDVLHEVTDTLRIAYAGREIKIKDAEVYGTSTGVAIRLQLRGDLKADVYLRGKVGFDTALHRVVIHDFSFDVNSDQALLAAADWLAHDAIISRLKPYFSLPVKQTFDVLPQLITKSVEKGKIGSKIDLFIPRWDVNVKQTLITRDNIQLILVARGLMAIRLQNEMFEKRKKNTTSKKSSISNQRPA